MSQVHNHVKKNVAIKLSESSFKKSITDVDRSLKKNSCDNHKECIDEEDEKSINNYWETQIQNMETENNYERELKDEKKVLVQIQFVAGAKSVQIV